MWLIRRILNWLRRPRRLKLEILIMPRDVRIQWEYPPRTVMGTDLDPDDFDTVDLEFRVTGAPDWTPLAAVDAPATHFDQPQLDFGTYDFRGRATMGDGRQSPWAERLAQEIRDDSAPVAMGSFEVVPQ